MRRADRRRLPLRSRHGHEPHRRDRVGDYVERVDRIGEGGDEVREGGEDDVEREEESRQIWTRKRACKLVYFKCSYRGKLESDPEEQLTKGKQNSQFAIRATCIFVLPDLAGIRSHLSIKCTSPRDGCLKNAEGGNSPISHRQK